MMIFRFFIMAWLAASLAACHQHDPANEAAHDAIESEDIKFQYTAYTDHFELFAEADGFESGYSANVLSHFSNLPDLSAVTEGQITLVLSVNGKESTQTLDKPTRKGIYSFDITPLTAGKGNLTFIITNPQGRFEVLVPEVNVFADHQEMQHAFESVQISSTNTAIFTKEQSWKVDFATGYPTLEAFGPVIKTTALVESSQQSEMVVVAKLAGMVLYSGQPLVEGSEVRSGQTLFTVSGNGLIDNNISVKIAEAVSNYEKARSDFERAQDLVKDKIVSEKDYEHAKNQYEITKALFENLSKNAGQSGQEIGSPMAGFIKQVLVKNGSFVEVGQAVLVVAQDRYLVLKAEIPQRYAPFLGSVQTAGIRSMIEERTYSLEELNGKLLSYGRAATAGSFLIPINFQIENPGGLIAGSFVELFIKTMTNVEALTLPLTAILEEQSLHFVWVQVTPELFEKREVRVGADDGTVTEITGGITSADRIVTRGAMLIKLAQATGALDAHSGHVH